MAEERGPVRRAVEASVHPGDRLTTPARAAPFSVARVDEKGVTLLLGEQEAATPVRWEALEGVAVFLGARGWVEIGTRYETSATAGTLDAYMKQHINRATAGWVAALLEKAGVVEVDRRRPVRVRLCGGF